MYEVLITTNYGEVIWAEFVEFKTAYRFLCQRVKENRAPVLNVYIDRTHYGMDRILRSPFTFRFFKVYPMYGIDQMTRDLKYYLR